jgi:hypothetical protein
MVNGEIEYSIVQLARDGSVLVIATDRLAEMGGILGESEVLATITGTLSTSLASLARLTRCLTVLRVLPRRHNLPPTLPEPIPVQRDPVITRERLVRNRPRPLPRSSSLGSRASPFLARERPKCSSGSRSRSPTACSQSGRSPTSTHMTGRQSSQSSQGQSAPVDAGSVIGPKLMYILSPISQSDVAVVRQHRRH